MRSGKCEQATAAQQVAWRQLWRILLLPDLHRGDNNAHHRDSLPAEPMVDEKEASGEHRSPTT